SILVTGCSGKSLRGEIRGRDIPAEIKALGGEIPTSEPRLWPGECPEDMGPGGQRGTGVPGDTSLPRSSRVMAVATPGSYRTEKYLYAVAAGVPIVHPMWLRVCKELNCRAPHQNYLLPLGMSAPFGKLVM
ncbi:unnamed protein product, partial [Discosporangium mesarthrocarpum]